MKISKRLQNLSLGIFSELAARKSEARQRGVDVIDLTIGSPDLEPPKSVMETLRAGVSDAKNYGYTMSGLASFNEAVSQFYASRYGVKLDAKSEVLQLMGSQEGLAHLAMAVVDEGDVVLVPNPGYPIYEASVKIAGAEIHPMALREENGFLPVLTDIPAHVLKRTKLMILNYPGNPVTALAPKSFFEEVVAFAKQHRILVMNDFAYSELVFDGVHPDSFLSVEGAMEVGIEFNSLSKTFNLAGCRLGYVVGNREAIKALAMLKSHIDYGVFYPIQKAGEMALSTEMEMLHHNRSIYALRRDKLVESLGKVGWSVKPSPATMFIWAKIPAGWTSREFAFQMLDEVGVAVTPGDAFGSEGEGYVRIALVQPEERLVVAAERVGQFLSNHSFVY